MLVGVWFLDYMCPSTVDNLYMGLTIRKTGLNSENSASLAREKPLVQLLAAEERCTLAAKNYKK